MGFCYNPNASSISHDMNSMGKAIDFLSTSYENVSLVGDFNAEKSNKSKKDFCDAYVFKHLIK